jgi:hypothetical protein
MKRPGLLEPPRILPIELRADLPDARIAGIGDDSEGIAVDVASGIRELCVVEDVEEFDAQIKRQLLSNNSSLQ